MGLDFMSGFLVREKEKDDYPVGLQVSAHFVSKSLRLVSIEANMKALKVVLKEK